MILDKLEEMYNKIDKKLTLDITVELILSVQILLFLHIYTLSYSLM